MSKFDAVQTPAYLNFRFPAEWEPHQSTWLAWPHRKSDWPGKITPIPWVYSEIIRRLSQNEYVNILVNEESTEKRARQVLSKVGVNNVRFWRIPTNRSWIRDYGPLFVRGPENRKAMLDFRFNAWAKYDDWRQDNAVPALLNEKLELDRWQPTFQGSRIVLEGGSIDSNGQGLLLTTEECLLSPIQARNPDMTRQDLERVFADYLGVRKVLWLNKGISGDDTHGHIDDLARFVAPGTVVTVVESNPQDENYLPLQENREILRGMTDLQGRKLEVVELPMPSPVVFAGQRLPASYANFYIANGIVLVPTFNDPQDRKALGILEDLFPGREVIGIHAVDLVWGLGTLHCMTQQEPA